MDIEESKQYAHRAGEVLAAIFDDNKKRLKPVDDAAKELIESEKDLSKVESQFNLNSIEIIYKYMREKYPIEAQNKTLISLITELKNLTTQSNDIAVSKSKIIYLQIVKAFRKIEDKIAEKHPNYKKKF